MHFLKTPLSLISSSIVLLLASAIPVSSTALTPDTFDATVQKGLWLIEHFSPYCSHCKHFKPTWDQLYTEALTEIPEVKMATIDCIMYGDLCDKNGVNAYPTLLMFEDGKVVEQFKGPRELEDLKSFMRRHVKDEPLPDPKPKSVAPKQPPKPHLNTAGQVLVLNSDTFSSTLAKGPAFVKFFAPWCGHCKKLAPVWMQFAKHMQDKVTVAEVNCDDHSSLCKEQGIQGYPTLMWYGAGDVPGGKSEYIGGRKVDQLKTFAEKASAAGVQVLEKVEDLDSHVKNDDVVYLLLHSADNTNILDTIREASAPLLGSPQVFASSDPVLHKRFAIASPWALVVIKDHDMKLPASIFYGTDSASASDAKLRKWLLTHRLPTALELTRDTFQGVMNAPQKPLVVIAAGPEKLKGQIMERLNDVGKKWRMKTEGSGVVHGREIVFAYMDGGEWAGWMKSMYGIKNVGVPKDDADSQTDELESVQVVIADHSRLVYYDGDRAGNPIQFTSSTSLFAAVGDAASGKSIYKNSETFVERIARNINAKMLALEKFVVENTLLSVLMFAFSIFAIFYVLNRLLGSESYNAPQQSQTDWKGQKGRLD